MDRTVKFSVYLRTSDGREYTLKETPELVYPDVPAIEDAIKEHSEELLMLYLLNNDKLAEVLDYTSPWTPMTFYIKASSIVAARVEHNYTKDVQPK